MRTFQVMLFVLCLTLGLYLLAAAPEFFMPARDDPAWGHQFGAPAARALGGGLLAIAGMAFIYLRHRYYGETPSLPGPAMQKLYFAFALLALALMTLAINLAEPVQAPALAPGPPPARPEAPGP
ncbi:MAG: hypothetical protein LBI92_10485 [Azoarcus sp.]|jgi:hypothetical protein|nr:hypothetical protein [Azoarcus sp.]